MNQKIYRLLLCFLCFVSAGAAEAQTSQAPGMGVQRTMSLLSSSTPRYRNHVKIVFVGQSIVAQDYARKGVEEYLRGKYPHAILEVKNVAIGGFTAPALNRTIRHTVIPEYPDLVFLHVYQGLYDGDYESIIRQIRSETTAEIVLWTHHIDNNPDAFESSESTAAMCRFMARKYGCELIDLRREWQDYLDRYNLPASDFLSDAVHLNDKGGQLMTDIIVPHLVENYTAGQGWNNRVYSYPVKKAWLDRDKSIGFPREAWEYRETKIDNDGSFKGITASKPSQVLRYKFTGNRVDLVSFPLEGVKPGTATVLLDGSPVLFHPAVYAATLPSLIPGSAWPGFRSVLMGAEPCEEDWKIRVYDLSEDGTSYRFQATGSVTGDGGTGKSGEVFVSKKNRIVILPQDSEFEHAFRYAPGSKASEVEITFSVRPLGSDCWAPAEITDIAVPERQTVVQGIANTEHTLEIIPNGDGPLALKEIVVYAPDAQK